MSAKFERLKEHVARQYQRKGYGRERAEHIGEAVAGKVAHEQAEEAAGAEGDGGSEAKND